MSDIITGKEIFREDFGYGEILNTKDYENNLSVFFVSAPDEDDNAFILRYDERIKDIDNSFELENCESWLVEDSIFVQNSNFKNYLYVFLNDKSAVIINIYEISDDLKSAKLVNELNYEHPNYDSFKRLLKSDGIYIDMLWSKEDRGQYFHSLVRMNIENQTYELLNFDTGTSAHPAYDDDDKYCSQSYVSFPDSNILVASNYQHFYYYSLHEFDYIGREEIKDVFGEFTETEISDVYFINHTNDGLFTDEFKTISSGQIKSDVVFIESEDDLFVGSFFTDGTSITKSSLRAYSDIESRLLNDISSTELGSKYELGEEPFGVKVSQRDNLMIMDFILFSSFVDDKSSPSPSPFFIVPTNEFPDNIITSMVYVIDLADPTNDELIFNGFELVGSVFDEISGLQDLIFIAGPTSFVQGTFTGQALAGNSFGAEPLNYLFIIPFNSYIERVCEKENILSNVAAGWDVNNPMSYDVDVQHDSLNPLDCGTVTTTKKVNKENVCTFMVQ